MFFTVSKVYATFLSPVPLLLILALVGAILSSGRFARRGRALAIGATLELIGKFALTTVLGRTTVTDAVEASVSPNVALGVA